MLHFNGPCVLVSIFLWGGFTLFTQATAEAAPDVPAPDVPVGTKQFRDVVQPFLTRHCIACHGEELQESKRAFHKLGSAVSTPKQIETWEAIVGQLQFGLMPPADEDQPSRQQRMEVVDWILAELSKPGIQSGWIERLKQPLMGNLVDHQRLFDGKTTGPGWSPARLWRISPYIHRGNHTQSNHYNGDKKPGIFAHYYMDVSQPFSLPEVAGIRDYAARGHLDVPTLELLLLNANEMINLQIGPYPEVVKEMDREYLAKGGHPSRKPSRNVMRFSSGEIRSLIFGKGPPTPEQMQAVITHQFRVALRRTPTEKEMQRYVKRLTLAINQGGKREGVRAMLTALLMMPESIYRMEIGLSKPDEHGRRMLSGEEIAYAVGFALTDKGPDAEILKAARSGKLATREEVAAQVRRLLDRPVPSRQSYGKPTPRVIRFFQEFFGYTAAIDVFKDGQRFGRHRAGTLVSSTDTLIGEILRNDTNVLRELLTTNRSTVMVFGGRDFRSTYESYNITRITAQAYLTSAIAAQAEEAVKKARENVKRAEARLKREKSKAAAHPEDDRVAKQIERASRDLANAKKKLVNAEAQRKKKKAQAEKAAKDYRNAPEAAKMGLPKHPIGQVGTEGIFEFPKNQRCGILTQPSWLVAHSANDHNDPVKRGQWVYQRLLGGVVPDVPITVDASVPKNDHVTLRERYAATKQGYCWRCHQRMNPLGMPFEMYDDFGRYRTRELLGDGSSVAVDASSKIEFADVPELHDQVTDAVDLMHRLAKSSRVRQVFVRHAFRFWMGRNETLRDSPTLIAADEAYVKNGGSMKSLIVSLLTSDPFLYRKDE